MHLGGPVGAVIGALVAERWERKSSLAVLCIVIAFLGLMYGTSNTVLWIIIFGFSMTMLLQTFIALVWTYTAECFPTHVRNSGLGLVYGAGRLGNAFGPLVIAFLFTHYGYVTVLGYIALLWVICGTLLLCGPKTKGTALA